MHWGHAISDDLIHWRDLPFALTPTPGGPDETGCWSGCMVNNGGIPTIIYTGVRGERYQVQTQCIATSQGELDNWEKYAGNPVLSEIPALSNQDYDFRDPFVWRDDHAWYMVLASRIKDVVGPVCSREMRLFQMKRHTNYRPVKLCNFASCWTDRSSKSSPMVAPACAAVSTHRADSQGIRLFGQGRLKTMSVWQMGSIWQE
jgi:hypothetical protein